MTLLDRLTRSAPLEAFPPTQRFQTLPFNISRPTTAGTNVTVDSAVELIPVYSAVNLIASAIGSLPCKVYAGSDKSEARSSRQWRMLHDTPNDEMSADELWQFVTACLLLWGNAFLYKDRDQNGVVQGLWPIRPSRVMVGREPANDGSTVRYFMVDGGLGPFYDVDILHIRGLSTDGLVGYSPIQLARQQLANDIAQQEFLGTFLKNGLFSSAVFTHPNRLSKEAQDRLREQISGRSGWLEAGKAITLEEGADLKNLTMSLVDSEFVQMAKMSEHRVAQLFGLIPPHTWGATDQGKTMTYQNSEFGGLEFVKWTLRPWLVRLESSVARDQGLFPAPGPSLFPEFLVDALLRADMFTRWQAYALGFGKWINQEWIDEVENITLPEGSVIVAPVAPTDQPVDDPSGVDDSGGPGSTNEGRSESRQQQPLVVVMPQEQLSLDNVAEALRDGLRALADRETRIEITNDVPEQRQTAPVIENHIHVPEQPAAVVENHVPVPSVTVTNDVPVPEVHNHLPEQPAPVVNNQFTLESEPAGPVDVTFERNPNGSIKSARIEEEC